MALIKSQDIPTGIIEDQLPEYCPDCNGDIYLDQDYMHCENWCFEGEAPMECPECESREIFGDGCEFECEFCGFEFGHESRRPAPDDPNHLQKQRSIETEVTPMEDNK